MRTYYRLESSMGGYLGASNTLQRARKLARTWSNSYGYAVNIFKAKRSALKETRGDIVQLVQVEAVSPSKKAGRPVAPASAWIPSATNPRRRNPQYEIYNHKTGDTMGQSFPTKREADKFIRYLQARTSLKLHWRARKARTSNPPIPSHWTPVSITRKGKQVQIKTRGR